MRGGGGIAAGRRKKRSARCRAQLVRARNRQRDETSNMPVARGSSVVGDSDGGREGERKVEEYRKARDGRRFRWRNA